MKLQNEDLLQYVRELESKVAYTPLPNAIEMLASKGNIGKQFLKISKQYLLGADQFESIGTNRQEAMLAGVIWFSLLNGFRPTKLLKYLVQKVTSERAFVNKIKARAGSNWIVTTVGVVYFFPMFAGIGISVLQTVGRASIAISLALLIYPFVILFIGRALSHLEQPARGVLLGILPYYAASIAVFELSRLVAGMML